ncbi:MAG: hypothetical protein LC808_02575 [Actinobacteria bacterium]|nr:hypothetical protein [Actinomycetota bacterium]
MRTSTAPAIIEVLATWAALVDADSTAINNLGTGQAELTGPGQQYQTQIALASRSLAQAAEDNVAADGSHRIQLVEAQLVTYQDLIGHSHADFRKNGGGSLGTSDLWYASHHLHTGILTQLDMLLEGQKSALDSQLSANSITMAVLAWVTPIVVLFVVLCLAQVFLKRRFRRTLNFQLLIATALLVGLSVVMSLTVISQHGLQESRKSLNQLTNAWEAQIRATDTEGQRDLRDVVTKDCDQPEGGCGVTITEFVADLESADQTGTEIDSSAIDVSKAIPEVYRQIATAAEYAYLRFLIPLITALIAVLILLGFRPRIEEYRYRPR